MGALDVCPFVPVMNVSMEECVTCANIFGQRLATELGVPGKCQEPLPVPFHLTCFQLWGTCPPCAKD